MSSFKTKLYRSAIGCCICGAKSSSSRFTSSTRYEANFAKCFHLLENRFGDICNACVLVVKRWRKLPSSTTKNWAHVVDSKTGTGTKGLLKLRKKEEHSDASEMFKYKHVYRKRSTPKRSEGSISNCSSVSGSLRASVSSVYPDFIDASYWKRSIVCCGVIFIGQLGEVMLDQRFYKKCTATKHSFKEVPTKEIKSIEEDFHTDVEDFDDIEFYKVTAKDKQVLNPVESDEELLENSSEDFQDIPSV